MRILSLLTLLLLTGCKSLFYHEVPHKILIESDPPGARIELNQEYIGDTPLEYTILGGHHGQFSENRAFYVFRATPVGAGYTQTKTFSSREPQVDIIPSRMMFNTRIRPIGKEGTEININQNVTVPK